MSEGPLGRCLLELRSLGQSDLNCGRKWGELGKGSGLKAYVLY